MDCTPTGAMPVAAVKRNGGGEKLLIDYFYPKTHGWVEDSKNHHKCGPDCGKITPKQQKMLKIEVTSGRGMPENCYNNFW